MIISSQPGKVAECCCEEIGHQKMTNPDYVCEKSTWQKVSQTGGRDSGGDFAVSFGCESCSSSETLSLCVAESKSVPNMLAIMRIFRKKWLRSSNRLVLPLSKWGGEPVEPIPPLPFSSFLLIAHVTLPLLHQESPVSGRQSIESRCNGAFSSLSSSVEASLEGGKSSHFKAWSLSSPFTVSLHLPRQLSKQSHVSQEHHPVSPNMVKKVPVLKKCFFWHFF